MGRYANNGAAILNKPSSSTLSTYPVHVLVVRLLTKTSALLIICMVRLTFFAAAAATAAVASPSRQVSASVSAALTQVWTVPTRNPNLGLPGRPSWLSSKTDSRSRSAQSRMFSTQSCSAPVFFPAAAAERLDR